MSSLIRRMERAQNKELRRKVSGLIAFGNRLGVKNPKKPAKRPARGSRRRTKPNTWRSKRETVS